MLQRLSSTAVPRPLRGPILVDDTGLPRYWATVWSTMTAPQLAESTHIKKLRYLESLYLHTSNRAGSMTLDDILSALDVEALSEILESWFITIRNQSVVTDSDEKRWQTGLDFSLTVVAWLSKGKISNDHIVRMERSLQRLKGLYSQLHVRKDNVTEVVRSLPANTLEALYLLLDPISKQNPFAREQTRWRVFVAFVLMLHQGLRRGEALILPVDAIRSAYDNQQQRTRFWLNVQYNEYEDAADDPRYSKPSVKNTQSIRQIPVSELTTRIVQNYVDNYRGRPNHSYLLNSHIGSPLSTEALTKKFSQLSRALPLSALVELRKRTGRDVITPHDLRHTCAVIRLRQLLERGDSMDEALQKLRTFFGWSKASTMPSRYARAVFEDRLAGVWNDAFDERVALVRALPPGM
ncbi:site-specific integrase [Burkholderia contaminans]|nr:site-specific integrase [Burkholderia contaminans]VWC84782.1 integrase [Burkholderia contaminans]HEM7878106.1 site-specific integrase [Burkholderia contaminans]